MKFFGRCVRSLIRRPPEAPHQFPTKGFKILDHVEKLEEENWEAYTPKVFYLVRIGEVFRDRYQVMDKLGYGAHSAVWLFRDLNARKYLTMKFCARNDPSARRELAVSERFSKMRISHAGALNVRDFEDTFRHRNADGDEYLVFLHEPLAISLETFRNLKRDGRLTAGFLRQVIKYLLLALDFLHTEAGIVHTDLSAFNIHLGMDDDMILRDFEKCEMEEPTPRKIYEDHIIYESGELVLPKQIGLPVLCDFGEARLGQASYTDDIQPLVYRAPEVMLDIPESSSADIWNAGVLAWHLREGKSLFTGRQPTEGKRGIEHHLAEMVSLLGPPPVDLLHRSETSCPWDYFDINGEWKASVPTQKRSLEIKAKPLKDDDTALFLDFIRTTLIWDPKRRPTAKQLQQHPWLKNE